MNKLSHNGPYLKLIDNLARQSGVQSSRANNHSESDTKWKKIRVN